MPLTNNRVLPIIVEPEGGSSPNSGSPTAMLPPTTIPKQKPVKDVSFNINDGKHTLGNDLAITTGQRVTNSHFKRDLAQNDRGRPMMEWIRKQSMSPEDADSPDSSQRQITYEELKQHNKQSDCWLALRGQVFDVTKYVTFHPGGVSEIMKGAGKDATALFNSIHRYVNFETILKGQRIGMYSSGKTGSFSSNDPAAAALTEAEDDGFGERKCWGCKTCSLCRAKDANGGELLPYTRFRENETDVFYQVELRGFKYGEDYWTVGVLGRDELMLKVVTNPPEIWIAHFKLKEALLNDTINVSFSGRARKMVVKLQKPRKLQWKSIGESQTHSNVLEDSRQSIDDMYPGSMLSRTKVAHNMYMIAIQVHSSARIGTPVGYDVKITIGGHSRRYTPISLIFQRPPTPAKPARSTSQVLYFIIKIYDDGSLTPLIRDLPLNVEESLQIGSIRGNFNTDFLVGADIFFLMAAGSGITPHIRILKHFMDHNVVIGASNVVLVHWSKEEHDLVWRAGFEKMSRDRSWFEYIPVLTQCPAEDKWPGFRGRISKPLMSSILSKCRIPESKKNRIRFITCGTDGFNCVVCETIESMAYPLDSAFIFLG